MNQYLNITAAEAFQMANRYDNKLVRKDLKRLGKDIRSRAKKFYTHAYWVTPCARSKAHLKEVADILRDNGFTVRIDPWWDFEIRWDHTGSES